MKQISFETTGLQVEKPTPTGTLPSATGAGKLPSFPRPQSPVCKGDPLDELPPLLRQIVPSGTGLLISWLRFGREPLDPRYHERALAALVRLEQQCQDYLRPSDPEDIINAIAKVAEVFQVSVPDEDGLLIYAAVLQELPTPLVKKAVIEVCKTHKYKTLPLPAEFLDAVKDDLWQWKWLAKTLPILKQRVKDR